MKDFEFSPEEKKTLLRKAAPNRADVDPKAEQGPKPQPPGSPADPAWPWDRDQDWERRQQQQQQRINPAASSFHWSPPDSVTRGNSLAERFGGFVLVGLISFLIYQGIVWISEIDQGREVPLISDEQIERSIRKGAEAEKRRQEQWEQRRREWETKERIRSMTPKELMESARKSMDEFNRKR